MSPLATYHSGTPQAQHPAVARWQAHLRDLATAIHEISGLGGRTMLKAAQGMAEAKGKTFLSGREQLALAAIN
ncbi:MAG: hypothetical protein PVF76_05565, partial [Syntrophobacterales bacterium]